MDRREPFSYKKRIKAFKYAGRGFALLAAYEHNFRIHLFAALVAIILGFLLYVSTTEWCLIILCIGGVLTAEALNTSLEVLCNRVTKNRDTLIGKAKDIAAAGVSFTALAALIVGILIFLPKLLLLF